MVFWDRELLLPIWVLIRDPGEVIVITRNDHPGEVFDQEMGATETGELVIVEIP